MEPVIRKLIVQGFRSIRSEVVDFDNPTFLVGLNGSGKTNLADALAFLSGAMRTPLPEVFSWRGGGRVVCHGSSTLSSDREDRTLALGVVLGALGEEIATARYAFQVAARGARQPSYAVQREQCVVEGRGSRRNWFERVENQTFRSNLAGFEPWLEESSLALPLIGGDARFAPVFRLLESMQYYSIDPDSLRGWQVPDPGRALYNNGSNAASVLRQIADHDPDDLQRICELMEAIVPTLKRVEVKEYDGRLELEFTQRWDDGPRSLTLEASAMSDGTLRALGLLAAVYQRPTPSLLVIEEPEVTIHPGALGVILDVLRLASRRTQVIVTTHSPEVLDADWLEDRHIRVVTWQDGATRVTPLSIGSRDALREHLATAGELFRSNALDGMPPGPDSPHRSELFEDLAA
jgi:predicted ATPase